MTEDNDKFFFEAVERGLREAIGSSITRLEYSVGKGTNDFTDGFIELTGMFLIGDREYFFSFRDFLQDCSKDQLMARANYLVSDVIEQFNTKKGGDGIDSVHTEPGA